MFFIQHLIITSFINFLKEINDYTGLTLIISVIIFFINDRVKLKNEKNLSNHKLKQQKIDNKTIDTEKKLYDKISEFHLKPNIENEECQEICESLRIFLIQNNLHLRKKIYNVASNYADYILEDVANSRRDIQKEQKFLTEFKAKYRKWL